MARRIAGRRIGRLFRDRNGSVSIITATAIVALIGSAAVSIDVGTLFNAKRKQQAATDLAAIVGAGHLTSVPQAIAATLSDNGIKATAQASIEYGTYVADPSLSPDKRFQVVNPSVADAIRITVSDTAPLFFGSALAALTSSSKASGTGVTIRTQATASASDFAAFAVGARLASLNGGIANAILGKLLGAQVSLSVMDYQALAAAQVDLFQFASSLAAQKAATGVTFGQTVAGSVRVVDALGALLASERLSGGGADAALMQLTQAKSGSADSVSLASLIDFGAFAPLPVGTGAPMSFRASALDAVLALAQISGRGRPIGVDLSGVIPGLGDVQLLLAVGAPPAGSTFTKVGRAGAQVQTAQMRLSITARLSAVPPLLSLSLPVYAEFASAKATLTGIDCTPAQDTPAVSLEVQPSLVDGWIGSVTNADLTNFSASPSKSPAPIATVLNLAAINGSAHVAVANNAPTPLRFTSLDIANGTKRSTSTTDLSASIAQTLATNLNLTVGPYGVAAPSPVSQAVSRGISTAAPLLDAALDSVFTTLGLRVGEADAWVTGVRCGGGVLVN